MNQLWYPICVFLLSFEVGCMKIAECKSILVSGNNLPQKEAWKALGEINQTDGKVEASKAFSLPLMCLN